MATTEHASVCPLDCPDTCSLTVTVENAKIVKIRGSRANPYTAGVICAKVAGSYPDWVHGPGRLQPRRAGGGAKGEGRFERVSWDQALDIVHERVTAVIAAHGPQAVAPLNYAGPHGMLAYASMDLRFFNRLGASLLERSALCGGIRTQAWLGTFGTTPGIAPEQVRHSRLIIAWGNNVTWSNLHLTPLLNAARKDGAKVVVIDPKRIKIAEQSDLHIALKPGTDVVLAWAVAAELERRGALDRAVRGGGAGPHRRGGRGRDPDARGVVPHALPRRDQRGQRARAQPERRQRDPRDLRAPGPGGKVRGAGRRAGQRGRLRVPQDPGQAAAA